MINPLTDEVIRNSFLKFSDEYDRILVEEPNCLISDAQMRSMRAAAKVIESALAGDTDRLNFLQENAVRVSFGVNANAEQDIYWCHAQGIGYRAGENIRDAIDAIDAAIKGKPHDRNG